MSLSLWQRCKHNLIIIFIPPDSRDHGVKSRKPMSGVVTFPGGQRQPKSSRHKERRCISAWSRWAVERGTVSRNHQQSAVKFCEPSSLMKEITEAFCGPWNSNVNGWIIIGWYDRSWTISISNLNLLLTVTSNNFISPCRYIQWNCSYKISSL